MRSLKNYWLIAAAAVSLLYCSKEKVNKELANQPIQMNEDQKKAAKIFGILPTVAENKDNAGTAEKVYLGKVLFHDPILSATGHNSCNSCHNLVTYGVDNKQFSTGDNGGLGGRNSPTVFNAALHTAQFWDGRAKDVEEQAGGPVMNPAEMAMQSNDEVIKRLKNTDYYPELFKKAYPDQKDPITFENMTKAIASFERTLLTASRFDKYLAGDDKALTAEEVKGMNKFIETGCIACHGGATLGGQMYQKFGVFFPYQEFTHSTKADNGRMDVTKDAKDQFMFKVMSLRNVEKTAPYFHDGSVKTLEEAVKIMAKIQLNKDLPDADVKSIVSFLNTLTGDIPQEVKEVPKEIKNKTL